METKKHLKHSKIERRIHDNYATNEIAVLGTKCSIIADFVQKIAKKLQKTAKTAYFDASHIEGEKTFSIDEFTAGRSGALTSVSNVLLNEYKQRIRFASYDLLFINGNHYQGAKQILILDSEKEASVKKRLDQLDRIQFVVKLDAQQEYFDFLVKKYPSIKNLRTYHYDDTEAIARHVENLIAQSIAPVQGLVLAGGKSLRMGKDKTQLNYHGKPQVDYAFDLLEACNMKTYLSVAKEEQGNGRNLILDKFVGLGAFGAICSAFQSDPNKAWLVLASDLPFVSSELLELLLSHRDPKKMATAIKGHNKEFAEPLITIYEPKAYPVLLNFLSLGYSCPRKALINSEVKIVEVDDRLIKNVNTPEDYQEAISQLKK